MKQMKKTAIFLILIFSAKLSFSKTNILQASANLNGTSITLDWGETDVTINPPQVTLNRFQIKYKPVGGVSLTVDNISNSLRTYTLTNLISGQIYEVELIEIVRVILPPSPFNVLPYLDVPTSSGVSTVALNAPPVAVCTPFTVNVGDNCMASVSAEQIGAGSYDPNGDATTVSILPVGPFNVGSHDITFTIQDIHGATSSCVNTVSVVDDRAPVVNLKEATVKLNKEGRGILKLSDVNNGIADNCGIDQVRLSQTDFTCSDIGRKLIKVSATDIHGNMTEAYVYVNVVDGGEPILWLKDAVVELNVDGYGVLDTKMVDNGSYDFCSYHSLKVNKTIFSCSDIGLQKVTVTATDSYGNTATGTVNVRVVDFTAPFISAKEVKVYLTKDGITPITRETPGLSVYDACGIKSFRVIDMPKTCVPANPIVNVIATDINGNRTNFAFPVTIIDTIRPVVKTKAAKLYLDVKGKADLTADMLNDGSSDNCSLDTIFVSKVSFDCSNLGTSKVLFTAKDKSGNIAVDSVAITVVDTLAPALDLKTRKIELSLDETGNAKLLSEDIINHTSDNCAIKETLISKTAFSCSDLGSQKISIVVSDHSGNQTKAEVEVTILDKIAPQIKVKSNLSFALGTGGKLNLEVKDLVEKISDNCEVVSQTLSGTAFDCSSKGEHKITITATDKSGNVSSTQATIIISDAMGYCSCSYSVLASEGVSLNGTSLQFGGVGTYIAGKMINAQNVSTSGQEVFLKSDNLQGSFGNWIKGTAPAPLDFVENTSSSGKNFRVKNDKTGTSDKNDYKRVVVGKNATLTLSANGQINIKNLKLKKGASLKVSGKSTVSLKDFIRLDEEVQLGEASNGISLFMGNNLNVLPGSKLNGYFYSKENIGIKDAAATSKTIIKGTLAGKMITAGANVELYGSEVNCDNIAKAAVEESPLAEVNQPETQQQGIQKIGEWKFGPNPTLDYLRVEIPEGKVQRVGVLDGIGNVHHLNFEVENDGSIRINTQKLRSQIWYLRITTDMETKILRIYKNQ
jgi:hypothetical protein